jgi:hypothetical protein
MPTEAELAAGTALAGGAIAAALLETLFDKKILSLEEARTVLSEASRGLSPVVIRTPEGYHASQIIGQLQRGKFSARG